MRPIEIACSHQAKHFINCGADAGQECSWEDDGYEAEDTHGWFHPERIEAAAAMTTSSNPPSVEEFDKAVTDLGIL